MPQTTELITTLNKLLKRHNKPHVNIVACLQLSEASVKRLLSEQYERLFGGRRKVRQGNHA